MASSRGKLFFDDAPKTPTRAAPVRKGGRADKKAQEEVAPISSPPTSPYATKSRRRESQHSKNALRDMSQVAIPLAGLGKQNAVDTVLARTLKASLSNKENDVTQRKIVTASIIDEDSLAASSESITPHSELESEESILLAPLVEQLTTKVKLLDEKVEATSLASIRRAESQDKTIDDIKSKLFDVIISLQSLEKESAATQQGTRESAYNALQLATKLQSRFDMFEMHSKRERQFMEKKILDISQPDAEFESKIEEAVLSRLKPLQEANSALASELTALKGLIVNRDSNRSAADETNAEPIQPSPRGIIAWLRRAGILSDSRVLTLKDAFVVALCVFLAGVAAIALLRAIGRRFMRLAFQKLVHHSRRIPFLIR